MGLLRRLYHYDVIIDDKMIGTLYPRGFGYVGYVYQLSELSSRFHNFRAIKDVGIKTTGWRKETVVKKMIVLYKLRFDD